MNDDYQVILFHSTSYAIWTSKILKKKGIAHKMIPVPRHISSDCGYCVRILRKDAEKIREAIEKNQIEYEDILPMKKPN
jgi:hypothetical protein